jgi:hypothetical protein
MVTPTTYLAALIRVRTARPATPTPATPEKPPMSDLTILTNHRHRDVLLWHELTDDERAEFDHYLDTDDKQADASFFRYRGNVYDLGEMQRVPPHSGLDGWDGYENDSFFSGTVVRYVDDNERVIAGRFFS